MKFTYEDLQKMRLDAWINNGILTFNDSTQGIQFLTLTDKEELKEVRFETPQPSLRYLDFGRCKIEKIVISEDCEKLQAVYLQRNQLNHFEIKASLPALELLDLSFNENLSELTLSTNLPKLNYLYLHKCDLRDLSALSGYFTKKGFDFNIEENKNLGAPPPEIIGQGKEAVVNYMKSLAGQTKKFNEIKVILVGEGKAGKTSLLKRIKGEPFDEHESQTHGVNIEHWLCEKNKVHFWDFGGQEIMHATHQFFLSERSIYVLLVDAREDDETKVETWLKHISASGGNSPVLVVINKIDENPSFELSRSRLNAKYPIIANRYFRVSCKKGTGIEDFIKSLKSLIPESELINTPFSVKWLKIKEMLENETSSSRYLDEKRFNDICDEKGVKDESSKQTLIQFLHDVGIVLHFKKLNLKNFFVLDPHWVTVGAYKVVNSKLVHELNGIIHEDKIDYVLNVEEEKQEEYKSEKKRNFRYSGDEPRYIIDLMQQFELCHKHQNGFIFIADQLKKDQPQEFDAFNGDRVLKFIFEYDFLPKTVIKRLIVQLFDDIIKKDINWLVWRNGMLLKNRNVEAAIVSDDIMKRITVSVKGEENRRRAYFSGIYHRIDMINSEFKKLPVKEVIPLTGHPEIEIEHEELLGYEKAGKDMIFIGKLGKEFPVSQLLNGYTTKEKRMEKENIRIDIHDLVKIGDVSATAHSISQASASNEISINISNLLGETENLKEDIERELRIKNMPVEEIELAKSDVEVFEQAIRDVDVAKNENKPLPPKSESRLKRFWEDIQDENSSIHKALKMIRKGKDYGVKLARLYNNIPGVPSIPPVALDIIERL